MSKKLQTKNTFKQLGTALTGGFLLLGMAATVNAADSGVLAGENSKNGARFYVSADTENSCAVTVSSNKNLRRFAFKDANGRTIRASGVGYNKTSITGFVDLLTAHPNGQLSVRTRDGVWTRLNAEFSLVFNECLADDGGEEPTTAECQFPAVLDFIASESESTTNTVNSCFVSGPAGSLGFNNSDSSNNGLGVVGYSANLSREVDQEAFDGVNFVSTYNTTESPLTDMAREEIGACLAVVRESVAGLCSNFELQ